jgi:RNA polymerase sigma factor for flagellar operon FliA
MIETLDDYIPLVRRVVAQMKKNLSGQADENELFSFGMIGLWDASQKFDSGLGIKFETYAVQRIRGAILDNLRQNDHASRTLRKKEKQIQAALELLEQEYLRKPTPKEISRYLGVSLKEFEETMLQIRFIRQESLETPAGGEENEITAAHFLEDHYFIKQEEWIEEKERKKALAELIDALPEREKLVLTLVYYENLSLTDVSKVLDVHKSRVSQLHAQAIKRLRTAVEKQSLSF